MEGIVTPGDNVGNVADGTPAPTLAATPEVGAHAHTGQRAPQLSAKARQKRARKAAWEAGRLAQGRGPT